MHPTLVSLPGLELLSYYVALAGAVVVCLWLGPRWAERLEGIDRRTTRRVLAWMGVAAFAGGRAHFVVNAWSFSTYSRDILETLAFWKGLHAGGALLALIVATPVIVRAHGLRVARFADALVPTIGVGIAIARFGCFLNGCCFGTPCSGPWCVVFPHESQPHVHHLAAGIVPPGTAESAAIHPIQLYWVAAALLATGVAVRVYDRQPHQGRVALVWLAVYLGAAAMVEPFRASHYPQTYVWWGRLQFEWIAVGMAVAAILALVAAEIAARRRSAVEEDGRSGAPAASRTATDGSLTR